MQQNIAKLRADGATYEELLAAHDPLADCRHGNIVYRAFSTKDGAVAIGALSASLRAKVRAAL